MKSLILRSLKDRKEMVLTSAIFLEYLQSATIAAASPGKTTHLSVFNALVLLRERSQLSIPKSWHSFKPTRYLSQTYVVSSFSLFHIFA